MPQIIHENTARLALRRLKDAPAVAMVFSGLSAAAASGSPIFLDRIDDDGFSSGL